MAIGFRVGANTPGRKFPHCQFGLIIMFRDQLELELQTVVCVVIHLDVDSLFVFGGRVEDFKASTNSGQPEN